MAKDRIPVSKFIRDLIYKQQLDRAEQVKARDAKFNRAAEQVLPGWNKTVSKS